MICRVGRQLLASGPCVVGSLPGVGAAVGGRRWARGEGSRAGLADPGSEEQEGGGSPQTPGGWQHLCPVGAGPASPRSRSPPCARRTLGVSDALGRGPGRKGRDPILLCLGPHQSCLPGAHAPRGLQTSDLSPVPSSQHRLCPSSLTSDRRSRGQGVALPSGVRNTNSQKV